MSRIGKQPVDIPEGVNVTLENDVLKAKGTRGELSMIVHPDIKMTQVDNQLRLEIKRNSKQASALWGTMRVLARNIIEGVSTGYRKQLELHGVGYRASVKGKNLELALGYSHPIVVEAPEGIVFTVEKEVITVEGNDKKLVGQVAANIRSLRKPEPYKGKGVRYVGEHVRRKVGKMAAGSSS
jgi:large subunit ribosomal protein L6